MLGTHFPKIKKERLLNILKEDREMFCKTTFVDRLQLTFEISHI